MLNQAIRTEFERELGKEGSFVRVLFGDEILNSYNRELEDGLGASGDPNKKALVKRCFIKGADGHFEGLELGIIFLLLFLLTGVVPGLFILIILFIYIVGKG